MDEGLSWTLLAMLAALLITAAAVDIKKREIPQWIVIAVALLAIPFWYASGLSVWPDAALQVGVAFLVFAAFAILFVFGWIGGGDVKLLGALALWLPWQAVVMMLVIMSFAGLAVTLTTVIWSRVRRPGATPEIPYGVAIAFAGLWLISERFLNQFG
jgi:prepilin peptidase CpaA